MDERRMRHWYMQMEKRRLEKTDTARGRHNTSAMDDEDGSMQDSRL